MNLLVENDIKNNIFSTVIKVKELGTADLTAEEEQAILEDFPTNVEYKNLNFEGKFNVNGDMPVLSDDGDMVRLKLTNLEIRLDEFFTATYKVDMKKIPELELGTNLDTKELVAQARCILFSETIKKEIKRILDDIRTKATRFTGETEELL